MAFHPRKGMQELINTNPMKGFYFLASISIIQSFLAISREMFLGFSLGFFLALSFIIVISPFIGALIFSIEAYLLRFVGNKWLNGTAPTSYIKACVAYSSLPSWINLIFVFVLLIGFPQYFFKGIYPSFLNNFQVFINNVAMLWGLIILIGGLAEAEKFTIGKAIGCFVLYVLMILLIVFSAVMLGIFIAGFFPQARI